MNTTLHEVNLMTLANFFLYTIKTPCPVISASEPDLVSFHNLHFFIQLFYILLIV